MTPYLHAAVNVLVHVPDLVRYGSKPDREIAAHPETFPAALESSLRTYEAAVAYAPNQVFIGNLAPDALRGTASPWYDNPIADASHQGAFGEILSEDLFYPLLLASDQFDLVMLDADWTGSRDYPAGTAAIPLAPNGKVHPRTQTDIKRRLEKGGAIALEHGGLLIGCVRRDHEADESLTARVLLENLAAKASGAYALRTLLDRAEVAPEGLDYIINCSEEAVGDRYNRGGGNLAKAIGEMVGCRNAAGMDVKAFCAAPVYALIHAAAMIRAGLVRRVAVVGGGSLAKLGMKAPGHMAKGMPVLEDVLGGVAFLLGPEEGRGPRVNLEVVGSHAIGRPSTPQGMMEALVCEPLRRAGRKLCEIDKYAVELHNHEITLPVGSGDVPLTNYKTLAALAVMKGEIGREALQGFVEAHGMPGFAPTQGHIPAGVPYLGHALAGMREGSLHSTMVVAKGSLFLGRMTQQADGASVLIET